MRGYAMNIFNTSYIYRQEYSKEVGFQEISYSKINVARIKEIRHIFAIRSKIYPFN